jgi:hypothetical protein
MNDPQDIMDEVAKGTIDHEVIYRIPASEDWPWGNEVGFVKAEGWFFAVNWLNNNIVSGLYAIEPETNGCFPSATEWMITDNDAIDYGLEA